MLTLIRHTCGRHFGMAFTRLGMLLFLSMNHEVSVDEGMLPKEVAPVVQAFASDIRARLVDGLDSITLIGSVVTGDFIAGVSDINTVVLVKEVGVTVLNALAGLGRRYGRKNIRAPLVMTTENLKRSLDVFPIECLDIKLIHQTIYGPDAFEGLIIEKAMLRIQCERELKSKLVHLTRGYVSAAGDREALIHLLLSTMTGLFPLLRALIVLADRPAPRERTSVLEALAPNYGISCDSVQEILAMRGQKRLRQTYADLQRLFEDLYRFTDALALIVDRITGM